MESSLPSGRPPSPGYPRSSPSAAGEILVDFLPPLFLPSPATMVAKMEGGGGRKSLAVTRSSSEPTNQPTFMQQRSLAAAVHPFGRRLAKCGYKVPLSMQKGGGGRRYGKEVGGEGEVGDISTSSLRPDEWSRKSPSIFRCLTPQTTT